MRAISILVGALAVLLLVAPASAHHRPGHAGGPPGQRGGAESRENRDPEDAPGNSGWAHACQSDFEGFANRGQCVAFHAHQRGADVDVDDDSGNDNSSNDNSSNDNSSGTRHGDLAIAEVQIRDDGTLRVRGVGAEDQVILWVGAASGLVVGFGEAEPAADGSWTVEGEWACQDPDRAHDGRIRVRDSDERTGETKNFPCDELEP